ncbi:MAG: hypothetical protein ACREL2_12005, partial [Gemmatimonadales bacterium]
MATTKEKEPRAKSGRDKEKAGGLQLDPAPQARIGKPRLQAHYETVVRPAVAKEFGLKNAMEIPRLVKIVLNVGMGEAQKSPKLLDAV